MTTYPWRVRNLALEMAQFYGRWDTNDGPSTKAWEDARKRFETELEALCSAYEAEIRRLRVAAAETEH